MKHLLSLLIIIAAFAASAAPSPFRLLKHGNFANSSITAAADRVTFNMKSSSKAKYIVVVSDVNIDITAQKKLMFRFRGAPSLGAGAHLTAVISYTSGNDRKWKQALAPSLKIDNKEFKSCTLGFDTDFRLPDSTYTLRQIKFAINSAGLPDGTDMVVAVDSVRVGDAAEGSAGELTVITPAIPKPVTADTRKIFFELDNDDDSDAVYSRYKKDWIRSGEPVVPAGFAELILSNTEGIFSQTDDISAADVIIYARTISGNNGRKIAEAVRHGKTLICAGNIPDKELAALAPLEVGKIRHTDFPQRRRIYCKKPFALKNLNDTFFPLISQVTCRNDAQTLLAFTDGTAFLAKKGSVYHFANCFGATVEKSDVYFDKLLLRLAGNDTANAKLEKRERELTEKQAAAELKTVKEITAKLDIPSDNWHVGASQENFSRFGWRIGTAMSSGILNNDLSFSSGDQSFKLSNFSDEAIALDRWELKALNKSVTLPPTANILSSWSGKGKVRYTASAVIPEAWKELEINFEVSSGIDDVDVFYVNGSRAGKTTTATPEYWMTPRRYAIDRKLVKFGRLNTFTLDVENLNGNAAVLSMPRLTAKKRGSSVQISVPELNWAARRCRAVSGNRSYEVSHSMATPMMLHDFGNSRNVLLSLENIAHLAAFEDASGKTVIRRFSGNQALYDRKRDGKMGKPYLLLYRTDRSRPLLLVTSGKIEKITPTVRGNEAVMLKITLAGKENVIAAGFPFGAETVTCPDGEKQLPERWKKKIADMTEISFNFPIKITELYRVDRQRGKIDIINTFSTRFVRNSWGVPQIKYAFIPPLAAFMLQENKFVSSSEKLCSFDTATEFGPTIGVRGKNSVIYSYDLPDADDFQIPHIYDKKCDELGNLFFADGVKWSCGGRTPVTAWSPEFPNGGRMGRNIDMFAWNFGLNSAMQGVFSLNDANLQLLKKRISTRFLEPLEKYTYKTILRHRREPFSGMVYPVLLQNYHSLYTPFAPGSGSKITFGDANEAHAVFMWMIQQLEDIAGQRGLASANWNLIKYIAKYELCIDDYAFMSGSCRDFGTGAWIDMLNCEYGGMMALARNAELAGDKKFADMALYRAARRAVPTIGRMLFRKYYNFLYPEKSRTDLQITGFGEAGAKYMMYPADNFNFMSAMDLFDFSEGFQGTMIRLYNKYVRKEVAEHTAKRSLVSLKKQAAKGNTNYAYLAPLAVYLDDDAEFFKMADITMKNRKMGDWPAMRRPFEINTVMWRKHGKITFRKFRSLDISKAVYCPESRELVIEYTAGHDALFTVESEMTPKKMTDNGRQIFCEMKNNELALPPARGKHLVRVQY